MQRYVLMLATSGRFYTETARENWRFCMFSHKRNLSPITGIALRWFFALIVMLTIASTTWQLAPQMTHKADASNPIPIKHIVFIIKENHSFDNYFGRFPGAHGTITGKAKVNGNVQTLNLTPIVDQPDDYCHVRQCYTRDYDH